jgi:DmsE family decaheme c-type cytochrome
MAWLLLVGSVIPAAGSDGVEDETCLMCHEGTDGTLADGPHRLASQMKKPSSGVACISCHEGGAEHVDNPSEETIVNPADVMGGDAVQVCSSCHAAHVELDNYGFDPHSVQEMNCSACHQVHGQKPRLLLDDGAWFCLDCHVGKTTDFMGRTNHPVMEGAVTCLDCHRFVTRQDSDLSYYMQGTCRQCHPEQGGPFPYEHDAINAYAVEGGSCTECHKPHGSENDRLLVQPGQMLCRQCHMVPPGHLFNSVHGDAWSQFDCATCHTAVHGSFDNKLLLDPNLSIRWGTDCYRSGCHSLNR